MKNEIKLYDYLDIVMQEQQKQQMFRNNQLKYFVHDIMNNLNIDDVLEINLAVKRTFDACKILRISKNDNFKKVYRYDGKNLHIDYKISALACYLIIINCNPMNEFVARAQLHYAMNRFKDN